MLHYLIVGGCGQVGFHLARRLLFNNHRVSIIDPLVGPHSVINYNDIKDWALCDFYQLDITQTMIPIKPWDVDRVFFLAESTQPCKRIRLQLDGVQKLLEWTSGATERKKRPPRILIVTPPEWHEAADAAIEQYQHPKQQIRSVRLFDVYGPRMPPRSMVGQMFRACLAGLNLTLYHGGQQIRSLIHIEDAATALYQAINPPKMPDEIEIGGIEMWKVGDLARVIRRRLAAKHSAIEKVDDDDGLPRVYFQHDNRVFDILGWRPGRTFDESFREIYRWISSGEDLLEEKYKVD